mgnify:CR=1 FL=1
MSRPLSIEYPDAWYHVMNRGRRGETIFLDDTDYQLFLRVLKEAVEKRGTGRQKSLPKSYSEYTTGVLGAGIAAGD